MPVLAISENRAGAPYFQITHCNFEAAAEFRVFPDSFKPFLRNIAELSAAGEGEISVGAAGTSADSAPDLVQLGKAHAIGIFNDERVYI